LADALGKKADLVAIGLFAKSVGAGSRGAARIARQILSGADEALVDAAMKALNI
jgi:hypothetical protein